MLLQSTRVRLAPAYQLAVICNSCPQGLSSLGLHGLHTPCINRQNTHIHEKKNPSLKIVTVEKVSLCPYKEWYIASKTLLLFRLEFISWKLA